MSAQPQPFAGVSISGRDLADPRVQATAPWARAWPEALAGRGFSFYLGLAVLLSPMVVPSGPAQTAIVDVFNLIALAIFTIVVLMRRIPIEMPLALPLVLVGVGSLLACTGALSLLMAVATIAGDLYLYLWFVMLVALLERRGEAVAVRRTWAVAAALVACVALIEAVRSGGFPAGMFSMKGARPGATFTNPNMLADYLMLSVFVVLGLGRHLRRFWKLGVLGLLFLAMIATRSNGGLISLSMGLGAWTLTRLWGSGISRPAVAGAVAVAIAGVLCVLWAIVGFGLGDKALGNLATESYFGRVSKSSESRTGIWKHLDETLGRSPLGIGPGNSSERTVAIGDRERPNWNLSSKEAHSDYMGYLVERGPIAFAGLLLATWMCFARVFRTRRRRDAAWFAACVGGLVATMVHASVIERLHFRHFWFFLALVWALPRAGGTPSRGERTEPAARDAGRRTSTRPGVAPAGAGS